MRSGGDVAQQLVNGLFLGSLYALFAVGYTLIFGVLDILNLAHQAVFMLGAVIALLLVFYLDMSIGPALLLAMVATGLIGWLLDRLAFVPLRRRPDTQFSGMISSIAMGLMFVAIGQSLFDRGLLSPNPARFPAGTMPSGALEIGGVVVSSTRLLIVAVAIVMMAGLTVMLRSTRLGRAIRAVAENQRAARLLGINVDRVIGQSFLISSALGGAAGVLYALAVNAVTYDMGQALELKGLAVIILGGMGSVPGAVLGGFLLGLAEVSTFMIDSLGILPFQLSRWRDAVAFTLLFALLVVRPAGLLGRRAAREA
ncbi:MAG: branched-chain amino acid ABC transporter permease [Chloroflexi bacterium]|nr:branched-chain amino acid ABC transporter permease [Chloroflexota bacterium]